MKLAWYGILFVFLTAILFMSKAEGDSSLFSHQEEEDSSQRKRASHDHDEPSSTHVWYPIYKETFMFFLAVTCAMCGLYVCLSMTFCHEHFYFMPLPNIKAAGQLRYVWISLWLAVFMTGSFAFTGSVSLKTQKLSVCYPWIFTLFFRIMEWMYFSSQYPRSPGQREPVSMLVC